MPRGAKPFSHERRIAAFLSKIKITGPLGCWEWQGFKSPKGYGVFWNGSKMVRAHKFAFLVWVGTIPKGLVVDHICENEACVFPIHIRVISNRENVLTGTGWAARNYNKTHCPKGHEYTVENTRLKKKANCMARLCRICHREYNRRRRMKPSTSFLNRTVQL